MDEEIKNPSEEVKVETPVEAPEVVTETVAK